MRYVGAACFTARGWFSPRVSAAGTFDQEYDDDLETPVADEVLPPAWGGPRILERPRSKVPRKAPQLAYTQVQGRARLLGANTTQKGRSPRFARARATAELLMA